MLEALNIKDIIFFFFFFFFLGGGGGVCLGDIPCITSPTPLSPLYVDLCD